MADIEQQTPVEEAPAADVEMEGVDMSEVPTSDPTGAGGLPVEDTGLTEMEPDEPKLVLFADLIKSPIVEVVVGTGDDRKTYSAHEAVLLKAPEFKRQIAEFAPGGPRRMVFPDADVEAMGSAIEYLYTNEYFPKTIKSASRDERQLERDPRLPVPDTEGLGLLAHARVYTLADHLQLPDLKTLALGKIHKTDSSARGELAYARYVYKETNPDDTTIRKPVAAFWATRSHTLRHESEPEFKAMCLEFPQFSYDVLQMVLDKQEKDKKDRERRERGGDPSHRGPTVIPGSSRKRARHSHVGA